MNSNLTLDEQRNLLAELRNNFDKDDLDEMCALGDREEADRLERLQRANFWDSSDSDDCGYANKAESYRRAINSANEYEQQRDLLVADVNLKNVNLAFYQVELDLEQQLAASFPNPGDDDNLRQIF